MSLEHEQEMWEAAIPPRGQELTGQERNELFVRFGVTSSDLLEMVSERYLSDGPNYAGMTEGQIERLLYVSLIDAATRLEEQQEMGRHEYSLAQRDGVGFMDVYRHARTWAEQGGYVLAHEYAAAYVDTYARDWIEGDISEMPSHSFDRYSRLVGQDA